MKNDVYYVLRREFCRINCTFDCYTHIASGDIYIYMYEHYYYQYTKNWRLTLITAK